MYIGLTLCLDSDKAECIYFTASELRVFRVFGQDEDDSCSKPADFLSQLAAKAAVVPKTREVDVLKGIDHVPKSVLPSLYPWQGQELDWDDSAPFIGRLIVRKPDFKLFTAPRAAEIERT